MTTCQPSVTPTKQDRDNKKSPVGRAQDSIAPALSCPCPALDPILVVLQQVRVVVIDILSINIITIGEGGWQICFEDSRLIGACPSFI